MYENNTTTHMKGKIIICVIICAAIVSIVLQPIRLRASEQIDYNEIGTVIDSSLSDLTIINNSLTGVVAVEDEQIILFVNKIPVTNAEMQFRLSLDKVSPQPRTQQEILDVLIKEKVLLSVAKEYNVLPLEEEINEMLFANRNEAVLVSEAEKFCKNNNLSLDEYWYTYERYNIIRILISQNVFEQYLQEEQIDVTYGEAVMSEEICEDYLSELNRWISQAEIVYVE